jgi:2-dehydro-3-deoxyphosphogluconate aldolase/(4S)-4-hydroxy-2-oxoglutarate aldolase
MNDTVRTILDEGLIMILRGVPSDKLEQLAEAMYLGGVRLIECTYDATGKIPDEQIAENIGMLVRRFAGKMRIGAGTVLTEKQVKLTKSVGGEFIISPDTNPELIRATKEAGLVSIPGALTPSEATAAHRAGADLVKLFPASTLGTSYLKTICAPLSHIGFLAVGGVKLDKVGEYLDAGAKGFGMGLTAEDRVAIMTGNYAAVTERCSRITEAIRTAMKKG